MSKVGIVTDSTCDLTAEELRALDVVMVPLTVHFGDEHFRDWIDLSPNEFYERLAAFPGLPTTSQPSPADFSAAYQSLASGGATDIVVVTLASALSGTFQSAKLASESATVPVRVIDGKTASLGTGLLVKVASEARAAGMDAAAIEARVIEVVAKERLFFVLDTLEYLVKGGRAGKAAGLAASLLNIKPILEVNSDGVVEPFRKVRGRREAIAALAAHVADESRMLGRLRCVVLHACDDALGREFEDALAATRADVIIDFYGLIGAVIGVYAGPRAVGVAYYPLG